MRRAYDRDYYETPGYRKARRAQRERKRLREVLARKAGGRLLEVGCGRGCFLELADARFEVQGIDISPYAISHIPESLQPKVSVGDVETMDLGSERYDVVVAFNLLEHLRDPQDVLVRVQRALRTGGFAIGSVPNRDKVAGRVYAWLSTIVDRTHVSVLTTARWRGLFREAGYTRVELFGEVPLGQNACVYLCSRFWRHLALILMFVCWK